jgi:hypothetical protein
VKPRLIPVGMEVCFLTDPRLHGVPDARRNV